MGPLLFFININDLPRAVSLSTRLLANHCVIYRSINTLSDLTLLQYYLNSIESWCSIWLMILNISKCKHVRLSNTNSNYSFPAKYFLNNNRLKSVSSYKYLGVHITSDLSWNNHTDRVFPRPTAALLF